MTRWEFDIRAAKLDGVETHACAFEDFKDQRRFAIVSLMDVLEHTPFPRQMLDHARQLIASGGILVVSTPNSDAPIFRQLTISGINPYWASSSTSTISAAPVFTRCSPSPASPPTATPSASATAPAWKSSPVPPTSQSNPSPALAGEGGAKRRMRVLVNQIHLHRRPCLRRHRPAHHDQPFSRPRRGASGWLALRHPHPPRRTR